MKIRPNQSMANYHEPEAVGDDEGVTRSLRDLGYV
jgi:hypothetical protein